MLVSQNESGCSKTVEDDHLCRFELPSDFMCLVTEICLDLNETATFPRLYKMNTFAKLRFPFFSDYKYMILLSHTFFLTLVTF